MIKITDITFGTCLGDMHNSSFERLQEIQKTGQKQIFGPDLSDWEIVQFTEGYNTAVWNWRKFIESCGVMFCNKDLVVVSITDTNRITVAYSYDSTKGGMALLKRKEGVILDVPAVR